jgi:hypothetical protein
VNQDSLIALKALLRQCFAGAGIVVLSFTALFSFGDHPLFDFNSISAFVEGLFRLAKSAALVGMAYALVRIWMEGYQHELEVNDLRRRLENRMGELSKHGGD